MWIKVTGNIFRGVLTQFKVTFHFSCITYYYNYYKFMTDRPKKHFDKLHCSKWNSVLLHIVTLTNHFEILSTFTKTTAVFSKHYESTFVCAVTENYPN